MPTESGRPLVIVTFPSVITPISTLSFGVLMLPSTLPFWIRLTSSEAVMLPIRVPATVTLRAMMSVRTLPVGPTVTWSSVLMSPWNLPSIRIEPLT